MSVSQWSGWILWTCSAKVSPLKELKASLNQNLLPQCNNPTDKLMVCSGSPCQLVNTNITNVIIKKLSSSRWQCRKYVGVPWCSSLQSDLWCYIFTFLGKWFNLSTTWIYYQLKAYKAQLSRSVIWSGKTLQWPIICMQEDTPCRWLCSVHAVFILFASQLLQWKIKYVPPW